MKVSSKIFILPFFGQLPSWIDKWKENMGHLNYDYIIDEDLDGFKDRVRRILAIEPNIISGTGKVWDYRPALGLLYEEEIKGYTHWGHTDFDCVYGDVDSYEPKEYDIWSNHHNYIMGAWSIYKNNPVVNRAFKLHPEWKQIMSSSEITAWVEKSYTEIVNDNLNVVYTHYQTKSPDNFNNLTYNNGKLYDGKDEIMMAHFRHTKVYPPNI
jgi:hypothetical protein